MKIIIEKLIKKISTLKAVIISAIFFGICSFFINGNIIGVAKLMELTGGVSILDLLNSYTVDQAYSLLESLGEVGRSFYLTRIIPMDFIFPLGYMLFYASLLALVIKKLDFKSNKVKLVLLVPIIATLLDYTENILIISLLRNYPVRLEAIAKLANIATQAKFIFVMSCIVLVIAGLVTMVVKWILKKKSQKAVTQD